MIVEPGVARRSLKQEEIQTDLAIIGGGLSGVCAAITAARAGAKVTLVQDRPVLGGNASSEVRLWVLGATSHMGNNNRWAREGGLIDELLVENMYRNPEGNALIFDSILLDKVVSEKNITLLLNTGIYNVQKTNADTIDAVVGFCSQNSTTYIVHAPFFCDASGDGIVGFLAGAAFRMGAEMSDEFDEKFAPTKAYGELLGHSLYFYSKDTGKPVNYIPPSFALSDITQIPRYKTFNAAEFGCKLWWIEYGGRLDTVHDTENIKWELWKVVYGVWNYIKNSGQFPEAETMTLEWVGMIPGKRESRRFEGDFMLSQKDIVEQRQHTDAVAYGGWSIDLHPADGVFSEKPGCNQWHGKGIYQIPYRCMYSKNIDNLFLAGRIISVSHVAFASTRVMATSAYAAQAVGMAAKLCLDHQVSPRALGENHISMLQKNLQKAGQYIPEHRFNDNTDLVNSATLYASSEYILNELSLADVAKPLSVSVAQMLPLGVGAVPQIIIHADADEATTLQVELRIGSKEGNYTPEVILALSKIPLKVGRNCISLDFSTYIRQPCYAFIILQKNEHVRLHYSNDRITGVLSVFNHINKAVSNYGKQTPPKDIGMDAFEFWCPQRRPEGQNMAIKIKDGIAAFGIENLRNGIDRPTTTPNAWVASFEDVSPHVEVTWNNVQTIKRIELLFDTDFDHPMETVLMTHPENVMPFCVRNYQILAEEELVHTVTGNYQTRNEIIFEKPIHTKRLTIKVEHPSPNIPAALFAVRCYA